jgi:subtilisin family serine protease
MAAAISAAPGPERSIVVFEEAVNSAAQNALVKNAGGVVVKDLNIINGKTVLLPSRAALGRLSRQAGVVSVEPDAVVSITAKPSQPGGGGGGKTPPSAPAETVPWGVDRIDADLAWPGGATGAAVKVGVIDTGIQLSHPDLGANIKGGYNAINSSKSADDDNGHGTHVAGTIGAIDNEIGVIGTAPQVDLYAIKVLDRRGSGYLSDVIEGLDWAVANGMDVVNMSLGSSSDVGAFRTAVTNADAAGLVMVAAAGNDYGAAVGYPAAYPEVIAVSAVDSYDSLASFSSVGPEVDFAAPGVSVPSTYKGSTYKSLSGTSMASPHVAGAAALVLGAKGPLTPAEVKARLTATADSLSGLTDSQQGSGLVDAEEAALTP